jgi:TonB-dependent SusC/RagA subfamily outer membrane receptor
MRMQQAVLLTLAGTGALLGAGACAHRAPGPTARTADSVEVGYGAQPKKKVSGAVTTLSDNDLATHSAGIEDLLQGKVAGLEIRRVGNAVTLRIRGTNSMLANQEPLVIVDDVMIQEGNIANALAGLTRDDIKQVNVLKDVASTSIYGFRGAGGVIVITTKAARPEQPDR